jgi:hypothetical protein
MRVTREGLMQRYTWDPTAVNCSGGLALALPLVYMLYTAVIHESGAPEFWALFGETIYTEMVVDVIPPVGAALLLNVEARDANGRTSLECR